MFSFEIFKKRFYSTNDNFLKSLLVNSPIIRRGQFDQLPLSENFFRQNPPLDLAKLVKLTFDDVATVAGLRRLDEINEQLNINMNLVTYMRLGDAVNYFLRQRTRATNGTSIALSAFLLRFKKGSKPIRRLMSTEFNPNFTLARYPHIRTYAELIGSPLPTEKLLKIWLESWNKQYLPHRLREFIFKSCSNLLGLNIRVAHFDLVVQRFCCFCSIRQRNNPPDETFVHLFFECPTTAEWLNSLEREFFNDIILNSIDDKKCFWFYGIIPNHDPDFFIMTAIWCLRLTIWENKLRKKIPSFNSFKDEFFATMHTILKVSRQLTNLKNASNFCVCRNWDYLAR